MAMAFPALQNIMKVIVIFSSKQLHIVSLDYPYIISWTEDTDSVSVQD